MALIRKVHNVIMDPALGNGIIGVPGVHVHQPAVLEPNPDPEPVQLDCIVRAAKMDSSHVTMDNVELTVDGALGVGSPNNRLVGARLILFGQELLSVPGDREMVWLVWGMAGRFNLWITMERI